MKNALNMFLEFWRLYFSSVFWMIVYLPRLMLWFLMILGPVAPIVIIGHKIAETPYECNLRRPNLLPLGTHKMGRMDQESISVKRLPG